MNSPFKKERVSGKLRVVENEPEREVPAAVDRDEEDFEFFKRHGSTHVEEGEGNWLVSYADMMTLLCGFFVVLFSFAKIDSGQFEKIRKETTRVFGGEYQKPFEKLSSALQKVIEEKKLGDQVFIQETEDGILVTFRGSLFFDSGSADMREQARSLLEQLVPAITSNSQDMGIVIEGHTDNRPIYSKIFPSNWELSSVRACTVLRFFVEKGFNPNKIKAIGWGEHRPVAPNEDKNGVPLPDNQAQNRRVVIKIVKNFDE
jgi:chemotaxis protein MotB